MQHVLNLKKQDKKNSVGITRVFVNIILLHEFYAIYKVVQIWPGLFMCKQVTVCPGYIWTTLYIL
jgi:hypothetical protein